MLEHRVACSPGANCLENLIQWPLPSFPLLWCQPRSLMSTLHPLAIGGGHSGSPISVLMTLQSPIIKHIDWTFSTLSRKEALGFPGSPRISEQSPINYLLIPQSSLDLSEFNMDSQFTPFTMKSKPLGIRCLKRKADLAFLQREGTAGRGGGEHHREHAVQFSSCQGAGADPGMTAAAGMSRGLSGAQTITAGRSTCLFEWLLAFAGFANLAMPLGWAEPGACQASWRLPGNQKCFRGYALESRGIRPWSA